MKNNIKFGVSALFVAILLLSTAVVPAVSGAVDSGIASAKDKQKGEIEIQPEIEVIEATDTSNILQVGNVLISLKSNAEHTEAEMRITDLTTDEVTTVNYEVEEVKGKFTTNTYSDGNLSETLVTDYNPLEPGTISKVSDISNQDSGISTNTILSASATKYVWDGVTFVKGSGVKYPHPDYDWYDYKGEVWQTWKITGTKLYHYHVSDGASATLLPLAPAAIGAGLGAYAGGPAGAVAGAVLTTLLAGGSTAVLVDEEGCIWFWWSKAWGTYIMPPTFTPVYIPKYFRIASYTLWNKISMSSP